MKLVTLNIWGGRVLEPFLDFVKKNKEIDIFCFQELFHNAAGKIQHEFLEFVDTNIFSKIQKLLPNHRGFFRPSLEGAYGIGVFVKNNLEIVGEGEKTIHLNTKYPKHSGHHDRNLQWLQLKYDGKTITIFNVHGLWNGAGKTDTEDRIAQSNKIRDFMDSINTSKILCGDFNLRPETKSIEILEQGMNNLIRTFGVETTRTSLYTKPEKFADYIFTSPEIKINDFKVLSDKVSDHAPLLLDFD